jgi:hypothetical protein
VSTHPELVAVALNRAGGNEFEHFSQDFLSAQLGIHFQPLGGVHDGGADGVLALDAFEVRDRPNTFMQASIENDVRGKIRSTVGRLREVGRVPTRLIYASSKTVKLLDQVEEELTGELDVVIRLFDAKYFQSHVDDSTQTSESFRNHLAHLTDFLRRIGGTSIVQPSQHVKSPAAYVFLRQELERRHGNTELIDAVVDSLILWALEGTDPDEGIFMTEGEIASRVAAEIPLARNLMMERVPRRLKFLSTKNEGLRRVNWHTSPDAYCLPFHTRQLIEDENAEDESLLLRVQEGFRDRLIDLGADESLLDVGSRVALRAMQSTYERQGLKLARYLEADDTAQEEPAIADQVFDAMHQFEVSPAIQYSLGDAVLATLRAALYASTEDERLYFGKLNRTYSLLFTLQSDPEVVGYFQDMAGDFYIYVGADVLVRCLSERYLNAQDQMTRNMLKMLSDAGAKLVLAEPVLREVISHLRFCDHEYRTFLAGIEGEIDYEVARNVGPIVLRAYLYSRLSTLATIKPPDTWSLFVEQICTYSTLHTRLAVEEVKDFLLAAFRMNFESTQELQDLVDLSRVKEVSEKLESAKKHSDLAWNDALLACAIYGRRDKLGEGKTATEFGHRTWWLTKEMTILRHTRDLVNEHNGTRYMMRPEFALNFLSFAPSAEAVRNAYASIFPSLLGIRLAKRMDETEFHGLINAVNEAAALEPARRSASMSKMADELKTDFHRNYDVNLR